MAAQIELWNFIVRFAEKWVGSQARLYNKQKQIGARPNNLRLFEALWELSKKMKLWREIVNYGQ